MQLTFGRGQFPTYCTNPCDKMGRPLSMNERTHMCILYTHIYVLYVYSEQFLLNAYEHFSEDQDLGQLADVGSNLTGGGILFAIGVHCSTAYWN